MTILCRLKSILKLKENFLYIKCETINISNNSLLHTSIAHEWQKKFIDANIDDSEFSIKCILAHILNKKFNTIDIKSKYDLSENQCKDFERLCECRLARMPLQYVIGEWDFYNLTLKMMPPVFIPRPETEGLVSLIIRSTNATRPFHFVDVGCGSGAISLSLLKSLPKSECVAMDRSKLACQLTKENSKILKLQNRIKVYNHTVNEESLLPEDIKDSQFDAIVSNPPYIKTKDLKQLEPEIILYENLKALDGGPDGFNVIRILLKMAEQKLINGGKIWLETDSSQPQIIKEIVEKKFKSTLRFIGHYKDVFQNERFVEIEKI